MLLCSIALGICSSNLRLNFSKSKLSIKQTKVRTTTTNLNQIPRIGPLPFNFSPLPIIESRGSAQLKRISEVLQSKISPSKSKNKLILPSRFIISNAPNSTQNLSNMMINHRNSSQCKATSCNDTDKLFFSPDKTKKNKFCGNITKMGLTPNTKEIKFQK